MTRKIGSCVVFAASNTPVMLRVHWFGSVPSPTPDRLPAVAPATYMATAKAMLLMINFILEPSFC